MFKFDRFLFPLVPMMLALPLSLKAVCDDPSLPEKIYFETNKQTFNEKYEFIIDHNNLCYKSINSLHWKKMPFLPKDLKGQVEEISADGGIMIALNKNRKVHFLNNARFKPLFFRWTTTWGFPFGLNPKGATLPDDVTHWSTSSYSPIKERNYVDIAGNKHNIGVGVTSLYMLHRGGQEITYYDPWLPVDPTYKICGPKEGRFKAITMASTASTIVVMNKSGDIFVRRYDFDMSGGDSIFVFYSYVSKYHTHKAPWAELYCRRKLPLPDWHRLPKVDGIITDHVNLDVVGKGGRYRLVRVEGMQGEATGYFELLFDFLRAEDFYSWTFIKTGHTLQGKIIAPYDKDRDTSDLDLGASTGKNYEGTFKKGKFSLKLLDFNGYCSPKPLLITFEGHKKPLSLLLHANETIHFVKATTKLNLLGAIEVPEQTWNSFDTLAPHEKKFIEHYLKKQQFKKVRMKLTKDSLTIKDFFSRRVRFELFPSHDQDVVRPL